MIVRVNRVSGHDQVFLGNFETTQQLPAVGDGFWYGTHGPFHVIGRTFIYKKDGNDDRPEDVILTVEELSKHA